METTASLAEAASTVRAARRRLVVAHVADGAARGALVGAPAGAAAWLVARWTVGDVAVWPLAAPLVGALVGVAFAVRRGVSVASAALALDAASGADESFTSAMTATDDAPEMRALAAEYAATRCPRTAVGRFLPLRAPAAASAAAVATALVAALVFVPRATSKQETAPPAAGPSDAGAGPAASTDTSPGRRVERMRDAVAKRDEQTASSLAPIVRKDLGAVTDDDLRKLASALVASSPSSDAAKRALAALDRGDRAAAAQALREALGGAPSATSNDGTGTATAAGGAPSAATPASWSGATWPLRYDRVVRRFLEESAAAEGRK